MSVGRRMREAVAGWNHDTLVRLLWDGDVLEIEVFAKEPATGSRNPVAESCKALRGRPGEMGFDLTSEADYLRLRNAIEDLIPLGGAASTDVRSPGKISHQFVPTACAEGCVLSVRAYAGDEDKAGWISIDLISNVRSRRGGSLSARLANALRASLGHAGGTAWCPLARPNELGAAIVSASSVAFPHLPGRFEHPARQILKNRDNGKEGDG